MPLNQTEIRTGEIDEILGKTPNRIIRWGVTVIFAVIVLVLIGSWFFKYPEVTSAANIQITTLAPPADVVARESGKIDQLLVTDNQPVSQDQVLAIIQNPANYRDVLRLHSMLDSLEFLLYTPDSIFVVRGGSIPEFELGELQSVYSMFLSSYFDLVNFVELNYYPRKIEALQNQISDYRLSYAYTYDQKVTLMSDLELAEKNFKRSQMLFDSSAIAEIELERVESQYLNKKYAHESIRTSLANINIQIADLENTLLDLQMQNRQQQESLVNRLKEYFYNLNAQIDVWNQRYLLRAPVPGICTFTKYWSMNQNVLAGEAVMTIISNDTVNIIGKLQMNIAGSGKVKTGQTVNIKLGSYPYMEFGMLEGTVHKISLVPNENFYYVEVRFPNGMKTNYGIDIDFSPNMQGTAEIITEDVRLFHKVLQPLRSLMKNRYSR